MKKFLTVVLLVTILLITACSPSSVPLSFDIPEEFRGVYISSDNQSDLVISQNDITEKGISYKESLLDLMKTQLPSGSSLRVTDFFQSSVMEGRYSFTMVLQASYQGQTASIAESMTLLLSGKTLTVTVIAGNTTIGSTTYTKVNI